MAGDEGLGRGRVAEAAVGSGGDAGAPAKVLGVALRALECCGGRTRAEGRDALGFERADEPEDEWGFGADDGKIDPLAAAECDQPGDVGRADRDAFRLLGDPGIAGGAIKSVDQRRGRNRPGERVLASACTHHQNPHRALSRARLLWRDG